MRDRGYYPVRDPIPLSGRAAEIYAWSRVGALVLFGIIFLCVAIIVIILLIKKREAFANVDLKAIKYKSWFAQHPRASYNEFIRENAESNIVEFNKMRKIYMLPVDSISRALRIN
jgi:hypothetical protein